LYTSSSGYLRGIPAKTASSRYQGCRFQRDVAHPDQFGMTFLDQLGFMDLSESWASEKAPGTMFACPFYFFFSNRTP
jgi:hypothetical protein